MLTSCSPAYTITPEDARFKKAMKVILNHEGGISRNKSDPGGLTNFGISLRFLRSEHLDVNGDGRIDGSDVIHLTLSEADEIYFKQWYLKYHYDKINNDCIMIKLFDLSVNAGASQAHKLLKRALNDIAVKQIPVTGVLDVPTIQQLNNLYPPMMTEAMIHEELQFYIKIVKKNRALQVFLPGWTNRANDVC